MAAVTTPDSIAYPTSGDPVTPLETVFANMATSIQNALNTRAARTYKPADLTALAALTGMAAGDLAVVIEGGAVFEYSGVVWQQKTAASFATSGARDTAYAKASGAYRVAGAQVSRTDLGYTERWFDIYNVTTNPGGRGISAGDWYPVGVPVTGEYTFGTYNVAAGAVTTPNLTPVIDSTRSSIVASKLFTPVLNGITINQPGYYIVRYRANGSASPTRGFVEFTVSAGHPTGSPGSLRTNYSNDDAPQAQDQLRMTAVGNITLGVFANGAISVLANSRMEVTFLGPLAA